MDPIRAGAPQFTTGASAPPPPQAPPQPQAAPPASDRVTLNQGEAPGYSYKHEQDSQGVQYQTWSARSGVKYEVATKDQETRFHVEVPQGVSPAPLEISGAAAPGQPVQLVAHSAGNPNQAIPVQQTPDGKYLISMGASGAVAMFDPQTMDFGIASAPQAQAAPNGQPAMYQALQQVVHADKSQTVKAHAFITEGIQGGGMMSFGMGNATPVREARYLQIDESANGQVTAKNVVERESPQQGAQGVFGQVGQMLNGPARQETAVGVTKQPDGSYAVDGGASLTSHMKASLQNPFALQSPLLSWMKGRKEQATVVQTFSSNPALLATMGAAAGPAAAMAMQTPFGMPGAVPPPPGFPR